MAGYASSIYLGEGPSGWVTAEPEQGALVLGPPRSGKTSCIVIPSVVAAPGPVVATSTKADVVDLTSPARSLVGACWAYDPAGSFHGGTVPVRWSPVACSGEWERALSAAHALVSSARPASSRTDERHWLERAEALMAPLLHACALGGAGVGELLRWVNRRDLHEAFAVLHARGADMAADMLSGIASTEARERSGIFSTAMGVLGPYNSPKALESASDPNFDPARFVESTDTLYLCVRGVDQERFAPLIVALLGEIQQAAYRRRRSSPPVLFALDEVANIAPMASLPSLVAEGGSQGLVTLACLQDLSQAASRWGAAANGFLSLFGSKVVFPGIADLATLHVLAEVAGYRASRSRHVTAPRWSRVGGSVTTSVQTQRRLPPDAIAKGREGCALLVRGASPSWIRLTPWYSSSPWSQAVGGSAAAQP